MYELGYLRNNPLPKGNQSRSHMHVENCTVYQSQGLSDIDWRLLKPNRLPKLHQGEIGA